MYDLSIDKQREFNPGDLIMWNGVDLEHYTAAMNRECLPQILQFLQLFEWDKKAERALEYLIRKYPAGITIRSKKITPKQKALEVRIEKEAAYEWDDPQLPFVLGLCPECGELMRGLAIPACESRVSARVFYKECTVCPYYSEIFWDEEKQESKEIEGGI